MNLLHRAMLSQQQRRQSRQIICPACGLPALFHYCGNGKDKENEHAETWTCGHCESTLALSELWPITPLQRAVQLPDESELSLLVLGERLDLVLLSEEPVF
jgi:ribosomal protein L37AE/L43A